MILARQPFKYTEIKMQFFRQYISPFLIFLIFLLALVAVSARIFLPSDMLAPAPVSVENINLYVTQPNFRL